MSPARRKTKKTGFQASGSAWPWRMFRGMGRLLRVALAAGVLGGVVLGGSYAAWHYAGPRIEQRAEYQVTMDQVGFTEPPPWVRSDLRREVWHLAGLPERMPLLDEALLERVANAFSLHPWVAEVKRVVKGHPSLLWVELVYRRPVAMVEVAGGFLAVDRKGVLLPSDDFAPADARRYPLIRGIHSTPAGSPGARWGDGAVEAAVKVAEVLAPVWDQLGLEAIEAIAWRLSEQGVTGTFYLHTHGGTRVIWGRPPDTDHPGELPAEEKIARLKNYVDEHGSLEAPDGPYDLDIRHWQEISRRPRAAK